MGETQDIRVAISVDLMEFCKEMLHSFPHLHQHQGDHRKLLESTANHLNHNFISKDLFMVFLTAKKIHIPLLSSCPLAGLSRVCTPDRAYKGYSHRSERGAGVLHPDWVSQ
jgi:hypothetical protein